jgi:hypothetical protein
VSIVELNAMEFAFLFGLDFRLLVELDIFAEFQHILRTWPKRNNRLKELYVHPMDQSLNKVRHILLYPG